MRLGYRSGVIAVACFHVERRPQHDAIKDPLAEPAFLQFFALGFEPARAVYLMNDRRTTLKGQMNDYSKKKCSGLLYHRRLASDRRQSCVSAEERTRTSTPLTGTRS